ncbi:MAG: hypothetical protein BWY38_02818 [Ignavibacteria bacterium ADurb.Bin266]|nr:MAG: hypothetical protein BWY38_02818 [Ignavibacteria bacterium ADurb.Bin266]
MYFTMSIGIIVLIVEENFQNGMCAHLGYDIERKPVVICDECANLLSETVVRYHWMESEYEKVSPESKLWRYLDLSKFLSMIGKKALYFAAAEAFDDIYEGQKVYLNRKKNGTNIILIFLGMQ